MSIVEEKRRVTKGSQVLDELRRAGSKGITNAELSKVALRYGGYLGKLYELGYVIEMKSEGNGINRYTLISEPDEEITNKISAYDKLVESVKNMGSITASQLETLINDLGVTIRYKAGTHQIKAGELQ